VVREYVENELGAIEDASVHDALDIALLRRREIVIEENQVGGNRCGRARNFFQLALADERCGIGAVTMLHEFAGNFGSGAGSKRAQFIQGLLGTEIGRTAAPAGGDAGGVVTSRLGSGSDGGPDGFGSAASRAELHAYEKRALTALGRVEDGFELFSRTGSAGQSGLVF